MSFNSVALPRCGVDIYPFEGGNFSITSDNGNLISVSTRKNIRADAGEFTIVLAPGGPFGIEAQPTWVEVITPMSLVIIAMQRGDETGIVMLGVVTSISEEQAWQTGASVTRGITITGKDFGYFFSMFSYYSLWFLGAAGSQLLGTVTQTPAGLPTLLGKAAIQGSPMTVGSTWYYDIMTGVSGLFSHTFVPYRGSQIIFSDAMATLFEDYPGAYIFPYGDSFISYEGSWIEKFRQIFIFPWYEFFIHTAPANFYGKTGQSPSQQFSNAQTASLTETPGELPEVTVTASQIPLPLPWASGTPFTSTLLGTNVSATPTLVARINPMPRLTNSTVDANGGGAFDGIDVSAWNGLPLFLPDSDDQNVLFPFINSNTGFSETEVINAYLINPTWFRGMFGGVSSGNNSNLFPWLAIFAAAGDVASIHKYGYRFGNASISWIMDFEGDISKGGQLNINQLMADIIARYASYYEPTQVMARSTVTTPLRPDILPGCRYRHQPFKNEAPYDFYIEGIDHNYVFGGPSVTRLTLSRGLPMSVYADGSTAGILFNALKGNVARQNGVYTIGVPQKLGLGATLAPIPPTMMASFLSQVAPIYGTPQAVSG